MACQVCNGNKGNKAGAKSPRRDLSRCGIHHHQPSLSSCADRRLILIGCWRSLVNDYLAAYPDWRFGVRGSENAGKCFIKRETMMKSWIFTPRITAVWGTSCLGQTLLPPVTRKLASYQKIETKQHQGSQLDVTRPVTPQLSTLLFILPSFHPSIRPSICSLSRCLRLSGPQDDEGH